MVFGEREDSQGGWPLQAIVARGLGEGRLDAGSSSRELEATAAWGLSELGLRLDGAGRAGSWRGQVKVGGYAMPFSGSSPGPQSTAVLDERVGHPRLNPLLCSTNASTFRKVMTILDPILAAASR